jgi:hypothetical protein
MQESGVRSQNSESWTLLTFEFWILRCESDTIGIRFVESRPRPRRGAGVVEQGCLLSSYTGKTGIGGSNPPLSAKRFYRLMTKIDMQPKLSFLENL